MHEPQQAQQSLPVHWTALTLFVMAVVVAAAFLARTIPEARTVDDAFITFRYSQNLVAGEGFVYNEGNRVLGTTTPLYALSMASIAAILGNTNYPDYALVVNALADSLSVVLVAMLGAKLAQNRWVGLAAAALWAVTPFSVTFAIGGMETSVHNLWMLAAWTAYLYAWPSGWVGAFVAFGILTRPDAVIWAAPLMLHQLYDAWRQRAGRNLRNWFPWQPYVVGLVIGLPWTIFATVYFGSFIPHTVGTKSVVYLVDELQAFTRLLQHYANLFHQDQLLGVVAAVGIGLILVPTLALIGAREALRQNDRALPLMVYPWLYLVVFAALNPLIFRWYLTPPLPALYLAVTVGMAAVLSELVRSAGVQRVVAGVLFALAMVSLLSAWQLEPDHGPERPAPEMAFHELELNYQRMAERLVAEYEIDDETLVAIGDIGSFGYYSGARILDTVGLVTEGLNDYYVLEQQQAIIEPGANYAIPPDMIIDYQPDFIVVMSDFVTGGLLEDPRFAEYYNPTPIYTIGTDYYGGAMWVFAHREQTRNTQAAGQ
jgi:hypothetical protein